VVGVDDAELRVPRLLQVAAKRAAVLAVAIAVLFKLGGGVGLVGPSLARRVVAHEEAARLTGRCRPPILFADAILLLFEQHIVAHAVAVEARVVRCEAVRAYRGVERPGHRLLEDAAGPRLLV
jgi:hypothetical protein